MFVFDASNKNTFDTLFCLIDTIKEIEKSDRKGKKAIIFDPKKMVVGNKKDLKKKRQIIDKQEFKKLEGNIKFREVSALTNVGVYDAFRTLITDIHTDNTLNKEYYDLEKLKKKE